MRWVVPLFKKHALPTLQEIGKTAVSTASNIATDAISGRNVKEAADEHINTAVNSIKEKVEKTLEGRGIKRKKRKFKKFVVLKKKSQFQDIFQ
jgi:50S ribosomal subunit-associated GTPase HflX